MREGSKYLIKFTDGKYAIAKYFNECDENRDEGKNLGGFYFGCTRCMCCLDEKEHVIEDIIALEFDKVEDIKNE